MPRTVNDMRQIAQVKDGARIYKQKELANLTINFLKATLFLLPEKKGEKINIQKVKKRQTLLDLEDAFKTHANGQAKNSSPKSLIGGEQEITIPAEILEKETTRRSTHLALQKEELDLKHFKKTSETQEKYNERISNVKNELEIHFKSKSNSSELSESDNTKVTDLESQIQELHGSYDDNILNGINHYLDCLRIDNNAIKELRKNLKLLEAGGLYDSTLDIIGKPLKMIYNAIATGVSIFGGKLESVDAEGQSHSNENREEIIGRQQKKITKILLNMINDRGLIDLSSTNSAYASTALLMGGGSVPASSENGVGENNKTLKNTTITYNGPVTINHNGNSDQRHNNNNNNNSPISHSFSDHELPVTNNKPPLAPKR